MFPEINKALSGLSNEAVASLAGARPATSPVPVLTAEPTRPATQLGTAIRCFISATRRDFGRM